MRLFLCVAIVSLVALAVLPETASAGSTPWSWHHATPVYSARGHVHSGHGQVYRGRHRAFASRGVVSSNRVSTVRWHHATPISSARRK